MKPVLQHEINSCVYFEDLHATPHPPASSLAKNQTTKEVQ